MTAQQAKDLQDLLASYWKNKGSGKRVNRNIEELVVLLAQIHLGEFKFIMENMDEY